MGLMKNIRVIVLIVLVLIALALLVLPKFLKPGGVIVTSVEADSPCKDIITIGSVITGVGGRPARNSNDFTRFTKNIEGTITFIVNNNPRSCRISEDSTLGVTVKNIEGEGLNLGVDVWGGTFYSFKPEEGVSEQTVEVLESRANRYGLSNIRIESEDSLIRIVIGPEEEEYLGLLTEQGALEGKLIQTVEFIDEGGEFTFNDKTYEVSLKNDKSILINDSEYTVDQYFSLDEVELRVVNISGNVTTFSVDVFDEKDLTSIKDPRTGSERMIKQDSGYVYAIPVLLSEEASKNFAKATKGQEVTINPATGESFLINPLIISIDGKSFIDLPVSGLDTEKEKKDLIVWAYRATLKEATNDMLRLKSIIETKRLPTKLVLMDSGDFSSTSGEFFTSLPLYTILIVSVVASILFFVRYRKRGVIVLPLILMILVEIVLILGTISSPWFVVLIFLVGVGLTIIKGEVRGWISLLTIFLMFISVVGIVMSKWVLDAPSIMGLAVVTVFSIGQATFMGDRGLVGEESYTPTDYKCSLRILWLSTTVATLILLPLFFVGGMFKGFFMTAIIGVLASATVTKPTYTDVIKKVCK